MAADVDDLCVRVRALGQQRDDARAQRSAEARVRMQVEGKLTATLAELQRVTAAHEKLESYSRQQQQEIVRLQGELQREREAHQKLCREAESRDQRMSEVADQLKGIMTVAGIDTSVLLRSSEETPREPSEVVS